MARLGQWNENNISILRKCKALQLPPGGIPEHEKLCQSNHSGTCMLWKLEKANLEIHRLEIKYIAAHPDLISNEKLASP